MFFHLDFFQATVSFFFSHLFYFFHLCTSNSEQDNVMSNPTNTTRTPVTALLSMEPLPKFDMVGFFGELGVQLRAKLIYSICHPSGLKELHALESARAEEVLELAFFSRFVTPFGSSSAALREAICQRAAVASDEMTLLRQKVLSDELWLGWMTENGMVFSTSACDAVARTVFDSSLGYAPVTPALTQATTLYGTDTDFMYRTRAAFHETHFAVWKFNSVTDRQRLDEHRAPVGTRRAGRKLAPPTGFPVISHSAKRFSGDVVCPIENGVFDPDARPRFVAVDEPTTGAFTDRLGSSLELIGKRVAGMRKKASSAGLPAVQVNRKRNSPKVQLDTTAAKRGRPVRPDDIIVVSTTALDEAVTLLGEATEQQQPPLGDELAQARLVNEPTTTDLLAPLAGEPQAALIGQPLAAEAAHTMAYVPPPSPTEMLLKDCWGFDATKELHVAAWIDDGDLLKDADLDQNFDTLFTKAAAPLLDEQSALHTGTSSTIGWSMPFDSFSQLPILGDTQE